MVGEKIHSCMHRHAQAQTQTRVYFIFAKEREIGKRSVDTNSHILRREAKPSVHLKCLIY